VAYGYWCGKFDKVGHKDTDDAEYDFAFVWREIAEESFERSHIGSTILSPRSFAAKQLDNTKELS
jgi:hypothetical protein